MHLNAIQNPETEPDYPEIELCSYCSGIGQFDESDCCGAHVSPENGICSVCHEHAERIVCSVCEGDGELLASEAAARLYEQQQLDQHEAKQENEV
jgi:predicted amidophosphoribosyltransferase